MSIVKLKNHPSQSQQNTNDPINQSDLEANPSKQASRAEKSVRQRYGWFWFYFSFVDKVASDF